jgi:glycosyltransferase involved in cell wall biosynthesis
MTKKSKRVASVNPPMPFVSVCTPTYNRRPFIPILFECFKNQKYPKHRLEWIIVDDGTDKIRDLVEQSKIPQIKYFPIEQKMTLGTKRNFMNVQCKGSIIVYMDDDDYYPPERISHAVEKLKANPQALCAGTSELYLYFKHIQKMYQFGPYGPNHATAATFAFRRELLNSSRYDDTLCFAEEQQFLKNQTVPFVQLEPLKTILVFSHIHNTCDKRKLLENINPNFTKESNKTVDMFIRNSYEDGIKQFFTNDIDALLSKYEAGEPKMKPDVLKQLDVFDNNHKRMAAQIAMQQQQQQQQIMMQEPGKEPVPISINDMINIINTQQQQILKDIEHIKFLEQKIADLENPKTPSKSVTFLEVAKPDISGSELESKLGDTPTSSLKSSPPMQSNKDNIGKVSKIKKIKKSFADAISTDDCDLTAQPKTIISPPTIKKSECINTSESDINSLKSDIMRELKSEIIREPEKVEAGVVTALHSKTVPEINFRIDSS